MKNQWRLLMQEIADETAGGGAAGPDPDAGVVSAAEALADLTGAVAVEETAPEGDAVPEGDPEPEATVETDPAPEGDAVPEGDAEPEAAVESDPEKLPEGLKKIYGEAVEKAKTLETKATTLEREVMSLRAAKVVPVELAELPFPDIQTVEQLAGFEERAKELKFWLAENPEGGECPLVKDGEGKARVWTAEEAADVKRRVERDLELRMPKQRAYLTKQGQFDEWLKATIPEAVAENGPLRTEVDRIIASFPAIKQMPGYRVAAVNHAIGNKLVEKFGKDVWKVVDGLLQGKGASAAAAPKKVVPASALPAKREVPATRGKPARVTPEAAPKGGDWQKRGYVSEAEALAEL